MEPLAISDFEAYFNAMHGYYPMEWQIRLVSNVAQGDWPELIDLPTGAGKTSCLDIAVFCLALQAELQPEQRTAPLRTFLVVDRRIVVDDAYRRACKIRDKLSDERSFDSVLGVVARRLLTFTAKESSPSTKQPLIAVQLRGGIYRDVAWARSITQPTLITSTVDQIGSRLLFRGYGISRSARPIQAAIVASDSLVLLDEAHCSRAFSQTLSAVRTLSQSPWSHETLHRPVKTVEMTATSAREVAKERRFDLTTVEKQDRSSVLGQRRFTSKPVSLQVCEKATGKKAQEALASELASLAPTLVSDDRKAIAIVVNRVHTAKSVFTKLQPSIVNQGWRSDQVELMIGRMRAWDRTEQSDRLRELLSSESDSQSRPKTPLFVVATQCIEVGADLDFDAMISEAAPLDSLRQRFGRLNRTGRPIGARGFVVIQAAQVKSESELETVERDKKLDDPVYGNALARTWNALRTAATASEGSLILDFGLDAMEKTVNGIGLDYVRKWLVNQGPDAPVLLPAHLDLLCQTNPEPWPDPEISYWLHGPQRANLEVSVCWRKDLLLVAQSDRKKLEEQWIQAISLCPPSSLETMTVPLRVFRNWVTEEAKMSFDSADVVEKEEDAELTTMMPTKLAVIWRGFEDSKLLGNISDLRPGDTVVIPTWIGGWTQLGHIPGVTFDPEVNEDVGDFELDRVDIAEQAYEQTRRSKIVRIVKSHIDSLPRDDQFRSLKAYLSSADKILLFGELRDKVSELVVLNSENANSIWQKLESIVRGKFQVDRYADDVLGAVFVSTKSNSDVACCEDNGFDDMSELQGQKRVSLSDHSNDMCDEVNWACSRLGIGAVGHLLLAAASMHDWGKCDPRFQAMLIRGDLSSAFRQPKLWAKSERATTSRAERLSCQRAAKIPKGFRHEMLSVQLAELAITDKSADDQQLILHLMASHHGYARPCAPVCIDDESIDAFYRDENGFYERSADWRRSNPPERLDSGIPERFWLNVRKFGWWGEAYLEAIFRLSDQAASARPYNEATNRDRLEEAVV